MRRAKQSYYRSQFMKNSDNPKRLWADLLDAIQKKKGNAELPNSFKHDNSTVDNPKMVAKLFNEYYSQVAPALDAALGLCSMDPLSYLNHVTVPEVLTFRPVSQGYVSTLLLDLMMSVLVLMALILNF